MPLGVPLSLPANPPRSAIFSAFGVPDDGRDAFEIGRPSTGATCLLQCDPPANWWVSLPLLRSEFLADDLIPSLEAAALTLGGSFETDGASLREQWLQARDSELIASRQRSDVDGLPPLPRMDAADLAAAHAWLRASPPLQARFDLFVPDIIAFASEETGDAFCATAISDAIAESVLVSPLHAVAFVSEAGVSLLDLAAFPRTADGLISVDRSHVELAEPVSRALRSLAVVEVIERETLARLSIA